MQSIAINWDDYPILHGEDPEYLQSIAEFAERLSHLSEDRKQRLALFKAAELINAIVQMRERRNASERLGPEKAATSFKIVRAAIRDRQITLPDGATIDLRDPEIRSIIDEACRYFHLGKKDPEQWQLAMALSTAQYIVLSPYLEGELDRYASQFQDLYPDAIVQAVKRTFIEPYRLKHQPSEPRM
ncbi:MAG: hypothetical protein AAFY11_07205 [Cyanobacteria bacterium J06641_5]